MRTRTGPAWTTARRILPSCATWHSTSCRRMARRRRCAASFSGPDGTTPISPASSPCSEVQLLCDPSCVHRQVVHAIRDRAAERLAEEVIHLHLFGLALWPPGTARVLEACPRA